MAQIFGSFSGIGSDKVRPYIDWNYSQDINGNYSDVTANLYFQKLQSAYIGWNLNGNATGNININGDYSTSNITFDLRTVSLQFIRGRTVRVFHNSDGTKSCFVGADGNTIISWGTYNFGAVVTLNTIPREAYLNNTPNFVIGDSIGLNLYNPGNLFIQSQLYVNGNLIKTTNHGQTSNTSIVPNSGEIAAMYSQVPNSTQVGAMVRIRTFSDAGYSAQVGGNRDTGCTAYVNQDANKPTFSTYSIANLDKSIPVIDKYGNTLITSSTQTLTGAVSRIIKGYSKVRATILSANKMVAQNAASAVKYRLIVGAKAQDANYSASDLNIEIDNVDSVDNSITAYDSRNLTTTVGPTGTFSLMANYAPIFLYGMKLIRDNGVDGETTLQFNGNLWNKYFSSDSVTNPGSGVLNTAVFEFRYKESTEAWGSQTWEEITPSIDSAGNISFDDYIEGDLGVGGFDPNKAFNIEVRAYDKLSQIIVEEVLSVGTPVLHITKAGMAMGRRFDFNDTSKFQLDGFMTLQEQTDSPSNPTNGDQAKVYFKSNKLIFQYNDGGTVRYKYLDLTGTGITWVHTGSAP